MDKITIYSTATCGYCRMLKSYLQSKNIAYEEKRADENPALAQELLQKSGQLGVPFSIFENNGKEEYVLGFDKSRIDSLLSGNK